MPGTGQSIFYIGHFFIIVLWHGSHVLNISNKILKLNGVELNPHSYQVVELEFEGKCTGLKSYIVLLYNIAALPTKDLI